MNTVVKLLMRKCCRLYSIIKERQYSQKLLIHVLPPALQSSDLLTRSFAFKKSKDKA